MFIVLNQSVSQSIGQSMKIEVVAVKSLTMTVPATVTVSGTTVSVGLPWP